MKKFLVVALCSLSFSCFAAQSTPPVSAAGQSCPQAAPTSHPSFCSSFKSVAECQCISRGLPSGLCRDMKQLYARMMGTFHNSLAEACAYQHDTSPQTCIDDWNCYRLGGTDSTGAMCSGTGGICG